MKAGVYGKPAAEIAADEAHARDIALTVTRCALCEWLYEGTALEGRQLAAGHRRVHHPHHVATRRRRRNLQRFNKSDDGYREAGNANAAQVALMVAHRETEGEPVSHLFGPSNSYYDPPEPPLPCCAEAEDGDPDHNVQACLDGQAEAAAEAKAERQREDRMDDRYEREEHP